MPTCPACGRELDAEELCRHETERGVSVHCPCGAAMGSYRDPK